MEHNELVRRLRLALGEDAVYTRAADLLAYEYDAGFEWHAPDIVVLPHDAAGVQSTVRLAQNAGVPIVTVIGVGLALLIGGVVITESVFGIPARFCLVICLEFSVLFLRRPATTRP